MATRRMEHLIRRVRRDTGNTSYGATSGIPQTDIVEWLNDAQENIQARIIDNNSGGKAFIKTAYLDVVAGIETITPPSDMLYESGIRDLRYSPTGNARNFRRLLPIDTKEANFSVLGDPQRYTREGPYIILDPVPQTTVASGLRIKYTRRLPRLDVRRGQVSAVTLNTGASTITSLTLTTGATLDGTGLAEGDFICVVDASGNFKMQDIPITSVDTSTGIVTTGAGFTYASGETISVGDYVVSGKYTTTHSELPPTAERYLIAYAEWKALKRDSNDDSGEQTQELTDMLDAIANAWTDLDRDIQYIPHPNNEDF